MNEFTPGKTEAVRQLLLELNTGLIDEEQFNARADAIGLTESECEEIAWEFDHLKEEETT